MEKPKVLVVDDEELLVKSTCIALGLAAFDARGAFDADEGLALAESFRPDIILLDIMMPGTDGWKMLEALKGNPSTREIPVIIFTAKEYANGKALAQSGGAVDYLAKPFRLEELESLLNAYVRKGNQDG